MTLEVVKKHPYVIAVSVFVVGLFVILAMRKKTDGSGTALASTDAAVLNAQTAQQIAAQQYGSQLDMAQLSAQVAMSQTDAQLKAVEAQVSGAEQIVATQKQGDVTIAQINADASTEQTRIKSETIKSVSANETNTALAIAQLSADAQARQDAYHEQIASQVVNLAGRDKGRSSTGWAQIISALEGRGPEAIAANQPSSVASSPGAILGGVAKVGSLFSSLFG